MNITLQKTRKVSEARLFARKYTGRFGEKVAERYMLSRGYSILDKNFRTPFGEIDLIAERDGLVVFLEVKTRISGRYGPPLASINRQRKRRIIKNCEYYLKLKKILWGPCRIDVMGIKLDSSLKVQLIQYVKNAIETFW